jgi:hypothetical protein
MRVGQAVSAHFLQPGLHDTANQHSALPPSTALSGRSTGSDTFGDSIHRVVDF